ncbi:FCD domain-containing protein [Yinghuangia sp. ASG 101]|uniref:FadR/GntR family transcriptional regulator n=1 Tax=Yinghuangia sp. ASG 101 TaxID=2896848 RepID=UPI001E4A8E1B|nr:FCD domain-containing protein [Yinghuangia sp. ASG 101]UGQ09246.1 FCD domain-containing protein [Yinghuangia sp. ASG 101]
MAGYIGRGVHGQTVEALGTRIVSGAIAEGEILDVAALIAELNVSQTPLREALKVLTAKGMVDARQKRGTFVRPRSGWNLLDSDVIRWQFAAGAGDRVLSDLAEVRDAVEPAAARLAAGRRTDADLEALDAALAAMATAADPADAAAADLAWHRALLAATHNELFQRMDIFIEPGLAERDRLVHAAHADDPVPSHQSVTDAVRDGDTARAEAAMRALLDLAEHDLAQVTHPAPARDAAADDSTRAPSAAEPAEEST